MPLGDKYVELITTYCKSDGNWDYWRNAERYWCLDKSARNLINSNTHIVDTLNHSEKRLINIQKATKVKSCKKENKKRGVKIMNSAKGV